MQNKVVASLALEIQEGAAAGRHYRPKAPKELHDI
jgi:hypothetical protein